MSGRAATENVIPGQYALSVGDAEMPCPPGWTWQLLTDVARLESGHTPSRNHPEWWGGSIPWIGIKDARPHHGKTIYETIEYTNEDGLANSAARLLPAGTVCLSRTASVGYVVVMGKEMATSQDFVNWICSEAVVPDFLKYLFIAEKESLLRFSKGTTHSTIYFPEVKAFRVCLPPPQQQKRIVAKIEALQARSDAAKQALDAIPPLLEQLRQSVLAAAFRGDLTRAWREAHPDVEPASELLERIRAERRRQWEEVNPKKKYVEPEAVDAEGLPELPEGWCWASPRLFFTWSSGSFLPAKELRPGQIPVYGGNGISGYHDTPLIETPTLVVGRVGAQCGNVHLTTGPAWITDNAIYAASGTDLANLFYWSVVLAHENLNANAGGTGQPYVNQGHLNSLVVPLPPEEEQRQIINSLDAITRLLERIEEAISMKEAGLATLTQSILAKAFRGELVPQDPNDEPASVLLDRIRAERSATAAAPKPKRSAKPKQSSRKTTR